MYPNIPALCLEPIDQVLQALFGDAFSYLASSLVRMAKVASGMIFLHAFPEVLKRS